MSQTRTHSLSSLYMHAPGCRRTHIHITGATAATQGENWVEGLGAHFPTPPPPEQIHLKMIPMTR